MKHYVARTKENRSACTSIRDEVREMFLKFLEDK